MATVAHEQCCDFDGVGWCNLPAEVWTFEQRGNNRRHQRQCPFFLCFLCLKCMQTKNVTLLYLLVVFDAISAQMIIMSMAHILLPKVHLWIYACGWYIRHFRTRSCEVKPCMFFSWTVVSFSSPLAKSTLCVKKWKIKTEKLIFNLEYLAKEEHECILVSHAKQSHWY